MGCDIHFYTERRNTVTGQWEFVGEVIREGDWVTANSLYDGRNYNLFAILANVRNGRGFAGVKTGEGFEPISFPRGVPPDASAEYKSLSDQMDGDGHSHSYLTLRELLDYDWTQTSKLQGWVKIEQWLDWSRWDRGQGYGPNSYCGGVSGAGVVHLSASQMDELTKGKIYLRGEERTKFLEENPNTYALAEWKTPYYRAAGNFVSETIPELLKLAGGVSGVEDVRVVFFFDN